VPGDDEVAGLELVAERIEHAGPVERVAARAVHRRPRLLDQVADDPVGAVAVHGFTGIWGTLSVGLFATGAFGIPTPDGVDTSTTVKGLFYGGGFDQLKAQFVGSITCIVVISAVAMGLMYLVKATGTLRVSKDGELEGLDIHEHGMPPYHMEFGQGMTYSSPANLPRGDRVTVVGESTDSDADVSA
jgi:hypothetical protein